MSIAFWLFVPWRWLLQANLAENLVTARPIAGTRYPWAAAISEPAGSPPFPIKALSGQM